MNLHILNVLKDNLKESAIMFKDMKNSYHPK